MGFVTPIRGYAAFVDICLEILEPGLVPVCFDIELDAEPCGSSVVRVGQRLASNGALSPGEGPEDSIGVGKDEHTASVEEHGHWDVVQWHAQNLLGGTDTDEGSGGLRRRDRIVNALDQIPASSALATLAQQKSQVRGHMRTDARLAPNLGPTSGI
jgi:hypothetical protein